MSTRVLVALAAAAALLGAPRTGAHRAPAPAAAQPCARLAELALPHVVEARLVPAGPAVVQPGAHRVQLPAYCRVRAVSRPTSDSRIRIEVWLPAAGWNGRYQQVGNGGWGGMIWTTELAAALLRGYAAAGTDDGHEGTEGAAWAVGHPERLVDYGYRALGETTAAAKALVRAFYGRDAARSYFVGCSDGGREALVEAQRFPEDFDGIVAGAPSSDPRVTTGFAWNARALTLTPESAIPPAKLPAITRAALAACDTLDGVRDGLVADPRACHFDPGVLACGAAGDGPGCLTPPQLAALRAIYAGPRNPRTGAQLFPGFPAGAEAMPGGWGLWLTGDVPQHALQYGYGTSYYGQAVFEDPAWDLRTLDFDHDVALGDEKVGRVVGSTSPDLRSFRAHGGKLLQYHGWADAAIAPLSSIEYYERVIGFHRRYPDPRASGPGSVQDFYRLFMVPGLGHCLGGAGPTGFGQADEALRSPPDDPERDVLAALVRWVERGVAPDQLLGSGPSPLDRSRRMTRPLCPYPAVARYRGGDPNEVASFACATR